MRPLLLLLAVIAGSAADLETITLTDGRILIGEVIPKGLHAAKVALLKPHGAVIEINLDEVTRRDAYVEPVAVLEPDRAPKAPAASPAAPSLPPVIVEYQRRQAELAVAQKAMAAAETAARETRAAAVAAWLAQADLAPLPVLITEKSTAAEIAEGNRRGSFNRELAALKGIAQTAASRPMTLSECYGLIAGVPWSDFVTYKHDPIAFLFLNDRAFRP